MAEGGFWRAVRGFLFGSVIGGIVGVLFAPKSGKETREEIKSKTDEVLQQGKEAYEAQRERIQETIGVTRQKATEKGQELKEKIEATREKVRRGIEAATESAEEQLGDVAQKAEERTEQHERPKRG